MYDWSEGQDLVLRVGAAGAAGAAGRRPRSRRRWKPSRSVKRKSYGAGGRLNRSTTSEPPALFGIHNLSLALAASSSTWPCYSCVSTSACFSFVWAHTSSSTRCEPAQRVCQLCTAKSHPQIPCFLFSLVSKMHPCSFSLYPPPPRPLLMLLLLLPLLVLFADTQTFLCLGAVADASADTLA
jgi:hypothetical protein